MLHYAFSTSTNIHREDLENCSKTILIGAQINDLNYFHSIESTIEFKFKLNFSLEIDYTTVSAEKLRSTPILLKFTYDPNKRNGFEREELLPPLFLSRFCLHLHIFEYDIYIFEEEESRGGVGSSLAWRSIRFEKKVVDEVG